MLFLPSALLGLGFASPLWGQSSNTPPDILVDDLPVAERSVSPWGSSGLGDSITFNLKDPKYVSDADPGDSRNFVCRITRSSSDSSEDLHLGIVGTDSCHRTFDTLLNPSWGSSDVFVVYVSDGTDSSTADLTIFQNSPPKVVGNDIESRGLVNRSEAFSVDVSTFFSDRDVSRTSDVLSFGLGKVKAPEGVDVDLTDSMLTASAPVEAAIYDIVVCATDTIMAQVCDSLVLDWSFNLPPVVVADEVSQSRLTLHPGGSFSLDLGSSDFVRNTEEDDPLSCELSRAMSDTSENVAYSLSGCSVTFRPGDVGLGSDVFTLTVTDSVGGSDSGDFVVVYSDPPPTDPDVRIGQVSPRRLIFPRGGSLVLDLSHSDFVVDPNNDDELSCTVSRAGSDTTVNVSFMADGCLVTFSAGPDGSGADQFSLEVDDNTGRTDSENFTVYQNTPPNIRIDDLSAELRSIPSGENREFDRSRFVSDPNSFQNLDCEISRVSTDTSNNLIHTKVPGTSCSFTFSADFPIVEGMWGSDLFNVSVTDGLDTSTAVLTMWQNTPPRVVGNGAVRLNRRTTAGNYVVNTSKFSDIFEEADSNDDLSFVLGEVSPTTRSPILTGMNLTVIAPASAESHTIGICAEDEAMAKACFDLVLDWIVPAEYVNTPPDILIDRIPQTDLVFSSSGDLSIDLSKLRYVNEIDTADHLTCTIARDPADTSQNVAFTANNCAVTFTPGAAGSGPDLFTLVVDDNSGGTDNAAFTVYQNTPPEIRIGSLPAEDRSIEFSRTFPLDSLPFTYDPDDFQTHTCIVDRIVGDGIQNVGLGVRYIPKRGSCDIAFEFLTHQTMRWGSNLFSLSISDEVDTTIGTFTLWRNRAPFVVGGDIDSEDRDVGAGDFMVDLSTLFGDRDSGETLEYELGAVTPANLTVARNGNSITVPAPNRRIRHSVNICAVDDAMARACDDVIVNWDAPLAPNILLSGLEPDQRVVAPGGSISFDLTDAEFVTDSDSDPSQDFVCSIIRSSTFTRIHVDHDLMGCQLSFSSGDGGWGSDQFTLTVSDGNYEDVKEVVIWQNRAPQIVGERAPILERLVSADNLQVDLSGHFADPDTADMLQYKIETKTPDTISPTVSDTILATTAPTGPQIHTIRVCAVDTLTQLACKTFTINWVSNRSPVISIDPATEEDWIVAPGGSLVLDLAGFVSNLEVDTLRCMISRIVTDTTQNLLFAANGCVITFEVGPAGWGSDEFDFTAEDASNGTAATTFVVWQNQTPVENSNTAALVYRMFSAGNHQIDLSTYFSDPDVGDSLDFDLGTLTPAGLTPTIDGNVLTAVAPLEAAMHMIEVCATDDATQRFCRTITVHWVDDDFNAPPDIRIGDLPAEDRSIPFVKDTNGRYSASDSVRSFDLKDPRYVFDTDDDYQTLECTLDRASVDDTPNLHLVGQTLGLPLQGCVASLRTFVINNTGKWGRDLLRLSVSDGTNTTITDIAFWQNSVPRVVDQASIR